MNFFQSIQFSVNIERTPDFSYMASKVLVPGITAQSAIQPNMFKTISHTADSLTFSNLSVTSVLDENLEIWEKYFTWMQYGFPSTFEEFEGSKVENTHFDDMTILAYDSKKNPFIKFEFSNIVPISITELSLDSQQTTTNPTEFTVEFEYDTFKMARI